MTGYDKILQLGWGNPTFLEPYWKSVDLSIPSSLPIQYSTGEISALQDVLYKIHDMVGNADTTGKYLVVGNGATQVLTAIFHVLKKPVYAEPPHFLRFPVMAELAGASFKYCKNAYQIITTPNNPTGSIADTKPTNAIYDLCYNWPQYTPTVIKHNQAIMVFSLSKATGHASTRIGWAWFKNESLARKVQAYIEHASCGVSIEAQMKAVAALQYTLDHPNDTCFTEGKKILVKRHNQLNKMKLPFKKLNHNGMFLWLEHPDYETFFCNRLIGYVDGLSCGEQTYMSKARINMGCSEEDWDEFILRIKN